MRRIRETVAFAFIASAASGAAFAQTPGLGGPAAAPAATSASNLPPELQIPDGAATDSMLDGKMSPMDQAMAEIEGKAAAEERGKIVGGVPAERGAYPFQVALFTTANGKDGMMCGGSLINMKWVLTAAHCITKAAENDAPYPATMVNVFAGGLSFGEGDRVPGGARNRAPALYQPRIDDERHRAARAGAAGERFERRQADHDRLRGKRQSGGHAGEAARLG